MLIAKELPLEKLTPEACTTALPLKLSAPEGSLGRREVDEMVVEEKSGVEENVHDSTKGGEGSLVI